MTNFELDLNPKITQTSNFLTRTYMNKRLPKDTILFLNYHDPKPKSHSTQKLTQTNLFEVKKINDPESTQTRSRKYVDPTRPDRT